MIESAIKIGQNARKIADKIQFLALLSELHDLLIHDKNPVIEVLAPSGQVRRMQIAGADEVLSEFLNRRADEEETMLRVMMNEAMTTGPAVKQILDEEKIAGKVNPKTA
jgi:hypothetical protein